MRFTLTILCTTCFIVMAQPPGSDYYQLSTRPSRSSTTSIRITIANRSSETQLRIRTGPPATSYAITAKTPTGMEPPRTRFGEALRGDNPIWLSTGVKYLKPGESFDQLLDLSEIWIFPPGRYRIGLSREVYIGDAPVQLTAETEIVVAEGYLQDKGCTLEARSRMLVAKQRLKEIREPAHLFGSNRLQKALETKVRGVPHQTDHQLVLAFSDILMGAQLTGGIAFSNYEGSSLDLYCVEKGESVAGQIEAIEALHPDLSLDTDAPVVNLLDRKISDFLETRIVTIEILNPTTQPLDALAAVFATAEMQAKMRAFDMEDESPTRPAQLRRSDNKENVLRLENVTAREALNAIVQRHGNGIWMYNEGKYAAKLRFNIGGSFGPPFAP